MAGETKGEKGHRLWGEALRGGGEGWGHPYKVLTLVTENHVVKSKQ